MGKKGNGIRNMFKESTMEWIIENITVWYALEIILIAGFVLYGILSDQGFRACGY